MIYFNLQGEREFLNCGERQEYTNNYANEQYI